MSGLSEQSAVLSRSGVSADVADLTDALARVDATALGHRLRDARIAAGLSQTELADRIASKAFLSRIEAGLRRPKLSLLHDLAQRCGVSVHELLLGIAPDTWAALRVELDWAQLSLRTGDHTAAFERTGRIVEAAPPGSELARQARQTHAQVLEMLGDYEGAVSILEAVLEEYPDQPHLDSMIVLCRCYRHLGELARAIEVGRRADQRVAELGLGGTSDAIRLTLTVAHAYLDSGDVGYAARLCQKALERAEAVSRPVDRAAALWNASLVESRRGHQDSAVELARQALHILDEADAVGWAARLRGQLGLISLRLSPPDVAGAREHLLKSEQVMIASDANPADLANNRLGQARADLLDGRPEEAARRANDCLAILGDTAPQLRAETLALLGRIALDVNGANGTDEAIGYFRQAADTLNALGASRGTAQLWFELGSLLSSSGAKDDALWAFTRAGVSSGLTLSSETVRV